VNAGLDDYADIVVRAIGEQSNVILVAQSLGGFIAPLVCARAAVRMLVFVNAMIPRPGETAGAWWENTGAVQARIAAAKAGGYSAEFDLPTYFLHDVPETVLRGGPSRQRGLCRQNLVEASVVRLQGLSQEFKPSVDLGDTVWSEAARALRSFHAT
jgi:hypothetical protein